jgi:hypothetical protein
MSLPAPHEPRHDGGRWETIRYAIDSNARTLRLCVIWTVAIVSPVAATVITLLVRHMLLCDDASRRPDLAAAGSTFYSGGTESVSPVVPVSGAVLPLSCLPDPGTGLGGATRRRG